MCDMEKSYWLYAASSVPTLLEDVNVITNQFETQEHRHVCGYSVTAYFQLNILCHTLTVHAPKIMDGRHIFHIQKAVQGVTDTLWSLWPWLTLRSSGGSSFICCLAEHTCVQVMLYVFLMMMTQYFTVLPLLAIQRQGKGLLASNTTCFGNTGCKQKLSTGWFLEAEHEGLHRYLCNLPIRNFHNVWKPFPH